MAERSEFSNDGGDAYDAGRRAGLSIGALAASLVAFVSLLGLEKALLALTLAILALAGGRRGGGRRSGRRMAACAIGVSCVYIVTYAVILIVFRSQLAKLLHLMQQLG